MATYAQVKNIEIDASEWANPSSSLPEFLQAELRSQAPRYVEEVTANLESIRNTWTGWSVLAAIARLGKKMVIKPWNKLDKNTLQLEQNATASPVNSAEATVKG